MNIPLRRLGLGALGLLMAAALFSCVASGGYVDGVYEGPGYYAGPAYEYGAWGANYHVGPPRGGERRAERPAPHAYRSAAPSRRTPSIPSRTRHH
jgi:hypothetical protein